MQSGMKVASARASARRPTATRRPRNAAYTTRAVESPATSQKRRSGMYSAYLPSVFRSKRRAVVYPQAEHGRMAGAIAASWRRDEIPLPFESWVRGVTLHDRGYGELDDDELLAIPPDRWAGEIQTRGYRERSGDDVADLVVALHIRRLIGDDLDHPARAALAREIDDALGEVSDEARTADRATEVCDGIAFAFCFEVPTSATIGGVTVNYDGAERVTLDPWPLAVPSLRGVVGGFRADGYPERLEPVVTLYAVEPLYL